MVLYDIRPLQLRMLEILKAVHKTCESHGLRYYASCGTLLGAVRHKGFIPWDDDIDIAMPRKDYDKLLSHAKEWIPEPFEAVSYETDPQKYPLPFAKIQDSSTTLIERQHLKYLGGIYIDVFPLDGAPKGKLRQYVYCMHYFFLKKILYFIHRDPYRHGHGPSCWIPLLCRKFFTMQEIQAKIRTHQKKYDFDNSTFIIDHDEGMHAIMPRSIYGVPIPIKFEDCEIMGVEQSHEYLKRMYGEYMVIPDGDHQRQHNFHLLDLENSYKEKN